MRYYDCYENTICKKKIAENGKVNSPDNLSYFFYYYYYYFIGNSK